VSPTTSLFLSLTPPPPPPTSTLFPYTTLFRSHSRNDDGTADQSARGPIFAQSVRLAMEISNKSARELFREVQANPNRRRFGLARSEEHTSELQSQSNLVCRLLLEKKKKK